MPISVRPRLFRPGDEEALLVLLDAAFGRWPATEISVPPLEHLRWKLRVEDPAPPLHLVTELDGRLVACELMFTWRFKAKERVLNVFESNDTCVHPQYQRRGLARQMKDFAMAEAGPRMGMHLFLSSNRSEAVGRLVRDRPGRREVANVTQVLVRPLRPRSSQSRRGREGETRRRLLHAAAYVTLTAGRVASLPLRRRLPASDWSLTPAAAFDARIDAFCEETAAAFDFISLRGADWLNWRYADPRAGDFSITLAEQHGRVLGYSVLRISRGRAKLADLLALPGRADVAATLIHDAVDRSRAAGAAAVECWLPRVHPTGRSCADKASSAPPTPPISTSRSSTPPRSRFSTTPTPACTSPSATLTSHSRSEHQHPGVREDPSPLGACPEAPLRQVEGPRRRKGVRGVRATPRYRPQTPVAPTDVAPKSDSLMPVR